jgi:ribonuclease P protein component
VSTVITVKRKKINGGEGRLFFIIPKSDFKKATIRNLLRRRIRVIMREFLKNRNYEYTIIVRRGAEKLLFLELKKEIEEALHI